MADTFLSSCSYQTFFLYYLYFSYFFLYLFPTFTQSALYTRANRHTHPRMGWHSLHIAFIWLFLGWILHPEQDNENHTVIEHKIFRHFGCSLAARFISSKLVPEFTSVEDPIQVESCPLWVWIIQQILPIYSWPVTHTSENSLECSISC